MGFGRDAMTFFFSSSLFPLLFSYTLFPFRYILQCRVSLFSVDSIRTLYYTLFFLAQDGVLSMFWFFFSFLLIYMRYSLEDEDDNIN
jgi:hypothetical protein